MLKKYVAEGIQNANLRPPREGDPHSNATTQKRRKAIDRIRSRDPDASRRVDGAEIETAITPLLINFPAPATFSSLPTSTTLARRLGRHVARYWGNVMLWPETTSPPAGSPSTDAQAKLPPTPESTPTTKRFKSSYTIEDGDNNKENIPPLRVEALRTPTRSGRSLRRTASGYMTPPRTRPTPRRASVSATSRSSIPATASPPVALTTPSSSPPAALQPICARARALLRPTCNSVVPMAGRGCERDQIVAFIKPLTESLEGGDEHSIFYISGSPGTGKTAMVMSVLHDMRGELQAADVTVITINCMALNNVEALWDRLKDEIHDENSKVTKNNKVKRTKETSFETIRRLFTKQQTKWYVNVMHIVSEANFIWLQALSYSMSWITLLQPLKR
ncbi:hypothetical protein NM688_g6617 [Phlebia brevispora]|uniref:Uncharacterized protein n=1 Tax=Phlebia brevispora TaxID=194682 RepID=A0ACC1SEH5_9APHY|nr:hypothetical protein NM688_g6617 [Phlebia brevispora]